MTGLCFALSAFWGCDVPEKGSGQGAGVPRRLTATLCHLCTGRAQRVTAHKPSNRFTHLAAEPSQHLLHFWQMH